MNKELLPQPADSLLVFLESQDFYEMMQAYRHKRTDAFANFEAIKYALHAATTQPVQPAMPICAAYGVKSKYGFDPADGHKQLIGISIGRPGTVFDDQIVELFTADALADAWREGQKAEAAHLAKCDSYYAKGDFGNHPQRVVNPYAPTNLTAPAAPPHP